MLFELMIESGTPAIDRGVQFEAHGEDGMRYLEASSGLRTYFAYEAFPNYYLDGEGSLLFKLPFADGVDTARLYATYSGGVKIDISTRPDGGFENLLTSQLGSSGTPPTNVFDLSRLSAGQPYPVCPVTGTAEGGFVDSLGVAVISKDVAEGGLHRLQRRRSGLPVQHTQQRPRHRFLHAADGKPQQGAGCGCRRRNRVQVRPAERCQRR